MARGVPAGWLWPARLEKEYSREKSRFLELTEGRIFSWWQGKMVSTAGGTFFPGTDPRLTRICTVCVRA